MSYFQESSLYCQNLFSKNILLFVVLLSWFLGLVCVILWAILNWLRFLYDFSFERLVLIFKLQRSSEVVAFKGCSFWPAWHKFGWKNTSRSPLTTFLYCFIILLHLISSSLHTRLLHIPYEYVSIDSIDKSLLSLFELKAVLLISLVKTFFFSHLTLCCVFNTSLLFFYKFLLIFLKIIYVNFIFSRRFILFSSWVASKQFL